MKEAFTEAELEAYLEESLDPDRAADVEAAARESRELIERMVLINRRRDAGVHSLGEIWRRHQLSVPSTEELGSFLLGVLDPEHANYITFRVDILKCPYTIAKLQDLQSRKNEGDNQSAQRRRKYFQSTAGYLRDEE